MIDKFLHDAIIEALPKAVIELEPVNTTQWDGLSAALWRDHGCYMVHVQDKRLSLTQRAVIAFLGNFMWGRRVKT